MAADRKSLNREAIEAFASAFDPPLPVVSTEAVGGARVANGWMCAKHLPEHEVGITAICWGKGHFKAFIEATGSRDCASEVAAIFSDVLSSLTKPSGDEFPPSDDGQQAVYDSDENAFVEKILAKDVEASEGPQELPTGPNPNFVDMMGLSGVERATLCQEFPQLRFSINAGQRFDSEGNPDNEAGHARADQVEHVRKIIREKNESKHPPYTGEGGEVERLVPRNADAFCDHKFKKVLTGGYVCIKCGEDAPPNFPDAAA